MVDKIGLTTQQVVLLHRIAAVGLTAAVLITQYSETGEDSSAVVTATLTVSLLLLGGLAYLLAARAASYGRASPGRQAATAMLLCASIMPVARATKGILEASGPLYYMAGMMVCFLWQAPLVLKRWGRQ